MMLVKSPLKWIPKIGTEVLKHRNQEAHFCSSIIVMFENIEKLKRPSLRNQEELTIMTGLPLQRADYTF